MIMAKTEVAKTEQTAVALPEGMDLNQLIADAQHNEKMGVEDVALPYIAILQKMSPQCDVDNPAYIDGARPGMFMNTVTGEIFEGKEQGLMMVPCAYERKFVEWIDRDKGGGFVGEHSTDSGILDKCYQDDKKRWRLNENGNFIVETAYQYVLIFNPNTETWGQALFTLKSTGLKCNRKWNNSITTSVIPGTDVQAPRYLYPYIIRTKYETKAENSWHEPDCFKMENMVDGQTYKAARGYAELVREGLVSRVLESEDGTKYDAETGEVIPS